MRQGERGCCEDEGVPVVAYAELTGGVHFGVCGGIGGLIDEVVSRGNEVALRVHDGGSDGDATFFEA